MKNKPIICFEGPSGIGKTTLCNLLSKEFNVVPEVNLLFKRSDNEPRNWYLERQVERFEMCCKSNEISILDGDIFQPIWYNWACNYPTEFLPKNETHEFYRNKLSEGKLKFPDLYIIFYVDEKDLWIRKEKDITRERRNFTKHLKIIEPLKDYYRFLDQETEIELRFIHYTDVSRVLDDVRGLINNHCISDMDEVKTFEQINEWINFKTEGTM